MAEREKVMKDLSWLIFNFPWQENPKDDADRMCNAIHTYCNDALGLLKGPEPRVLYSTEIDIDTVYWMEQRNINQPWPVAFISLRGNPDKLVYEDYYGDKWTISGYCVGEKGWRCWTSRPTEEQRKAVPWEPTEEDEDAE